MVKIATNPIDNWVMHLKWES